MDLKNLSDEELILKAREKNEEAQNEIYSRYKNLVKKIIKSFYLIGGDQEDLLQEGMLGLFKAVENYKGEIPFKNYASVCIKSSAISAIKKSNSGKNKFLNNCLPLESGVSEEESSKITFSYENPEFSIINNEAVSETEIKIKESLSDFEYKIFLYYSDGFSYQDIADKTGKTVKSIDNAVQRIRKKLREVL